MSKDDFSDDFQGGFGDDYSQPEYGDEVLETGEQPTSIEVKVSDDKGATWYKFDLDITVDLENSGLKPGQLLIMNDEKYEVVESEYGDLGMRPYMDKRRRR